MSILVLRDTRFILLKYWLSICYCLLNLKSKMPAQTFLSGNDTTVGNSTLQKSVSCSGWLKITWSYPETMYRSGVYETNSMCRLVSNRVSSLSLGKKKNQPPLILLAPSIPFSPCSWGQTEWCLGKAVAQTACGCNKEGGLWAGEPDLLCIPSTGRGFAYTDGRGLWADGSRIRKLAMCIPDTKFCKSALRSPPLVTGWEAGTPSYLNVLAIPSYRWVMGTWRVTSVSVIPNKQLFVDWTF